MSPQARRKSAAQKKQESEVTEAQPGNGDAPEPTQPQEQENPSDKPEVSEEQPSEEQEENQSPPQEQPPEQTDQEKFDEQQRGGRKVGKTEEKGKGNNEQPRGGRKIGKAKDSPMERARAAREEQVRSPKKEAVEEYKPRRQPLEAAGLDQHAAEEARQAELAEARTEHNERTGDGSLR